MKIEIFCRSRIYLSGRAKDLSALLYNFVPVLYIQTFASSPADLYTRTSSYMFRAPSVRSQIEFQLAGTLQNKSVYKECEEYREFKEPKFLTGVKTSNFVASLQQEQTAHRFASFVMLGSGLDERSKLRESPFKMFRGFRSLSL
jgi:hypothetical protein